MGEPRKGRVLCAGEYRDRVVRLWLGLCVLSDLMLSVWCRCHKTSMLCRRAQIR